MNPIPDDYEKALRPMKLRFRQAAALFLVAALTCIGQVRTCRLLEHTRAELIRARAGLLRVRQANLNRGKDLAALDAGYTRSAAGRSPEELVYEKIDELKARFHPDDLTISALARKDAVVSLQYSFKFINPNYNEFLTMVSYLEGSAFPFTPVASVALAQAQDQGKQVLSCSISGKVLASANGKSFAPEPL